MVKIVLKRKGDAAALHPDGAVADMVAPVLLEPVDHGAYGEVLTVKHMRSEIPDKA